ncbi:MAG: hypothetical protein KDJ39_14785 [Gammaproteobacteria bacterium]|nr:hypothetical protein [Gammaproteobacteria bacterium]
MWRGAVCVLLAASGTAQAEPFVYRGQQLTLAGTAQACYLRFVDLFDAEYFRNTDGSVRCVRLRYHRDFDRDTLYAGTLKAMRELYGEEQLRKDAPLLQQLNEAYRGVDDGDSYQLCVRRERGGELLRDGQVGARFVDIGFAERVFGIWLDDKDPLTPRWRLPRCFGDDRGAS